MDLGRLRGTDWVVGVLSASLLGSLFLPWYQAAGTGLTRNAWQTFAVTDVVLAAFAVLALGIVLLTATQRTAAVPIAWTALTAAVSLVATGFMIVAALSLPREDLVRDVGPVVGLALTLALTGAVWSTMRNERPGPATARSPRAEVEKLTAPRQ